MVAIHPGRVDTGLGRDLAKEYRLMRILAPIAPLLSVSPIEGVKNHLWTSTSPNVVSGTYYEPVGVPDKEGEIARDGELRKKLWTWLEDELKDVKPVGDHSQAST